MNSEWKRTILLTAGILTLGAAGGLIASTALLSRVFKAKFENEQKREQTLTVTGSARKRVRSDIATWSICVSGEGADLKAAYASLKTGYEGASAFLAKSGFKPEEIVPDSIQTQTRYKKNPKGELTDQLLGYTLSRTITVTTSRVDAVAKPASEITELMEHGISISSQAPSYTLSKISDLKIEMIGEASKDARLRADQLVNNTGCRIADVRTARVGVMQITKPESTDVSDGGIYDTSSIDKDVRSVVNVTFSLAQ
jgi:hypothetical protein